MANPCAVSLASTRFMSAEMTAAEAEIFDQLCERSGLHPSIVGGQMIAFVCRSVSGLREIRNGDIDEMLTDEFGDIRKLYARIADVNARAEIAVDSSRVLVAMIKPVIGAAASGGTDK